MTNELVNIFVKNSLIGKCVLFLEWGEGYYEVRHCENQHCFINIMSVFSLYTFLFSDVVFLNIEEYYETDTSGPTLLNKPICGCQERI